MTERAGDTQPRQVVLAIDSSHRALEADYGVQLEQSYGRGGIVEIYLAGLYRRCDLWRNGVSIDLEPDREGGRGADGFLNDFVHPGSVRPKLLVAEGIEAEHLAPGCQVLRR